MSPDLYRCQQLMYVFPVLRWLKVFSQTWEGDVTMVLPSSYMQLKKSVTNPTNKDLLDACKQVPTCPSSDQLHGWVQLWLATLHELSANCNGSYGENLRDSSASGWLAYSSLAPTMALVTAVDVSKGFHSTLTAVVAYLLCHSRRFCLLCSWGECMCRARG